MTSDDHRPLAYFEAMYSAYLAAEERRGGGIDHFFTVAGRPVRARFAGSALIPHVVPALAHLTTRPAEAVEFTICAWDTASTGIPLPPVHLVQRAHPRSPSGGPAPGVRRIRTSFRGRVGAEDDLAVVSVLDTARRLAVQWVPDAHAVSPWDRAGPLLVILSWILDGWGVQLAHAGAVGTDTGGLLLTGKSGSGKSTTTLACLQHDLVFVGDDVVGLSTGPWPEAWSLYSSARLNPDSLALLPELARAVSNPDRMHEDKALILLHGRYPDRLRTRLPIHAIVVPQVTDAPETRLVPATRAESLAALAPTSLFQVPDASHNAFRALADFVRRVPSYRLELGKRSGNAPCLLSHLLGDLGAGSHE